MTEYQEFKMLERSKTCEWCGGLGKYNIYKGIYHGNQSVKCKHCNGTGQEKER